MHKRIGLGILVATLATLSACQSRPHTVPSIFQLSKETEGAAISAAGARDRVGGLQIRIDGFLNDLQGRRVLATIADVETVIVTVTPADGSPMSQTLNKAAISGGVVTATFTNVPIGGVTVKMEAFDVNGQLLGRNSRPASVVAGSTTTVELPLWLNPAVTSSSPLASGGGDGGSSHGDVLVNGSVHDGGTLHRYDLGLPVRSLAAAPDGKIWAYVSDDIHVPTNSGPDLFVLNPDGTLSASYTLGEVVSSMAFDDQGRVWATGTMKAFLIDPTSGTVTELASATGAALAHAGDGTMWLTQSSATNGQMSLIRFAADGSPLSTSTQRLPAGDIARAPDGSVWLTSETTSGPSAIARVAPTGEELAYTELDGTPLSVAVDQDGNAWVATMYDTLQFSPTGAELTRWDNISGYELLVTSSGDLWYLDGSTLIQRSTSGVEKRRIDLEHGALEPYGQFPPTFTSLLVEDSLGGIWGPDGNSVFSLTP